MNTLDVCCALIELPAARGPLLLGAKKKTGQSNGLLYEFPGGNPTGLQPSGYLRRIRRRGKMERRRLY